MYRSTTSFTTKDYDVRPRQILEDDFTSQEEIQEFLRIGYIEVYDDTLDITENGLYDVEDYQNADVNVPSSEPVLQSKEITINTNGTTTVTADQGYDGLSDVDVTVSGILDTSDANAVANNIESGKTAYVNGQKITGNIETYLNIQLDTENIKKFINRPANNGIEVAIGTPNKKILLGAPSSLGATVPYTRVATTIGLTAEKIKKDEVICGVTGTYEGASTSKEEKDVNFYDYDGTVVESYTKSEFLALQSMPANPSHEGLTAQGWNWSLADAQDFVTDYGILDIGQIYVTDDGKTRIYISLLDERKSPYLRFAINGTATIDWGDNSATEQVTGSDTTTEISTPHTYSTGGNYVISIASESPIYFIENGGMCKLLNGNGVGDYYYRNSITKIEIGTNMTNLYLSQCQGLKHITIPNNVTTAENSVFYNCRSLENVNIPANLQGNNQPFSYCTSIRNINLANNYFSNTENAYANCVNLKRIIIPQLNSFGYNMFQNCQILKEIIVPDLNMVTIQLMTSNDNSLVKLVMGNVANITNSYSFRYCKNMKLYDFNKCTNVPLLSNVTAFDNIPVDCQIIVPDALYEDWIVANNWSSLASHIVKASEA